jgi:hypothetical protein
MVQYWLAANLGELWLTLHKSLRPLLGELPGECALVARGRKLSAGRMYRAQAFAARVWWRTGITAALLVFPVIGASAALHGSQAATDVGVGVIFGLGCVAGVAMLQMGLLSFRSSQIRLYLVNAGANAREDPLPPGSLGQPTRWDFWVVFIIAVAVFGILLYAGTRTAHGG